MLHLYSRKRESGREFFFFVSCALVSLSLSVIGKNQAKGARQASRISVKRETGRRCIVRDSREGTQRGQFQPVTPVCKASTEDRGPTQRPEWQRAGNTLPFNGKPPAMKYRVVSDQPTY